MGRPPIGNHAMTSTERSRRRRARLHSEWWPATEHATKQDAHATKQDATKPNEAATKLPNEPPPAPPALKARIAELEAERNALKHEVARLKRQLEAATTAPAKAKPQPAQWQTPKQLERGYAIMPKGLENFHLTANWLRGHKDRVIEITIYPVYTGDPLDPAEQMLAKLPGVYRIARIVGGRFGGEGDDLRKQARALMAVTARALQAEAVPNAWSGGVVVYDPRES